MKAYGLWVWLSSGVVGAAMCATGCGGSTFTSIDLGDAGTGSTGSSSTAGTNGSNGGATATSGNSGSTAGGTTGGSACGGGATVTFKAVPAQNVDPSSLCRGGCDSNAWLSVSDPDGHTVNLGGMRSCNQADCSQCEPTICPPLLCVAPQPLTHEGLTYVWDETVLVGSTCNGATGQLPCADAACAQPGRYTATMCVARSSNQGPSGAVGTCTPSDQMVCDKVEFELPTSGANQTVVGTLSP